MLALAGVACAYAGMLVLMEATTGAVAPPLVPVVSSISLFVSIAGIALVIAFEVRAYRALTEACDAEPEMGDKMLLGAALWFFGRSAPGIRDAAAHRSDYWHARYQTDAHPDRRDADPGTPCLATLSRLLLGCFKARNGKRWPADST